MSASPHSTLGAVSRLDEASLLALVGANEVRHLRRKSLGGVSGYKGMRFEHFFGAHRIARLARKLLEEGQDALIEWQGDAFVDDVIVRRDTAYSFKGYQLKNARTVSWTAGDRPIGDDFRAQQRVCQAEGYTDVRLRLVCSDADVASSRRADVPADLVRVATSIHFPYLANANHHFEVLNKFGWIREDFAYLARAADVKTIEASNVAGVLMGAWDVLAPSAWVSQVLARAREMSPTIIRSFYSDEKARDLLLPDLCALLESWHDFAYKIERGFLRWSAFGGSTSGILSVDCFDPKFTKWQQLIVNQGAASFDQAEGAFL